jgi:molybdate transport system substrate-binding protein
MRAYKLPILLAGALTMGCGSKGTESLEIYAAASTREALDEIARNFSHESGVTVNPSYGATSTLARQIEGGAPADLFLSAEEERVDQLESRGLIEQRRNLLGNRLVVIVPEGSRQEFNELKDLASPDIRRIALGGPEVPVGKYAREALTKVGTWDQVKDRVINGSDVSAVRNYIARGEADAGIVYFTDVATTRKARLALEISPDLHSPIRYPLAVVRKPQMNPRAVQFRDYLLSDAARAVFEKAGFTVLP